MWGSGPNDVYAVGEGTVAHFDGSTWSLSTIYPIQSITLDAVWGTGPNDVWAGASGGAVEHWDGTSWSDASGGFVYYVAALWGSGAPNDVWAVGLDGAILHHR